MKHFKKYIDNGATMFILKSPVIDYKVATAIIIVVNSILGYIMYLEGYTFFDYPLNIVNIAVIISIYIALYMIRNLIPKALDLFGYGDKDNEYHKILRSILKNDEEINKVRKYIESHLFNNKDLKYSIVISVIVYISLTYQYFITGYKFYNYTISYPNVIITIITDQTFFFVGLLIHAFTALYSAIFIMFAINKAIKKENLRIWHFNNILKNEILFAAKNKKTDMNKLHNTIKNMEPFHKFRQNLQEIAKIPLVITYTILAIIVTGGGSIVISKILKNEPIFTQDIFVFAILTFVALTSIGISTKSLWSSMRNVKRSLLDIFEIVYDELEQKYMLLMAMGRSPKLEEIKNTLNEDLDVLNSMITEVKGYKTFPITTNSLLKIITSAFLPIISMIIKMYMQ